MSILENVNNVLRRCNKPIRCRDKLQFIELLYFVYQLPIQKTTPLGVVFVAE